MIQRAIIRGVTILVIHSLVQPLYFYYYLFIIFFFNQQFGSYSPVSDRVEVGRNFYIHFFHDESTY